jgi:hypothetical protein
VLPQQPVPIRLHLQQSETTKTELQLSDKQEKKKDAVPGCNCKTFLHFYYLKNYILVPQLSGIQENDKISSRLMIR